MICSICHSDTKPLTLIQGTLICIDCLKKVTEETKKNEESLISNMASEIIKENSMKDIYD